MEAAGANQYITKPYDIDEFFAQVGRVIEMVKAEKRARTHGFRIISAADTKNC